MINLALSLLVAVVVGLAFALYANAASAAVGGVVAGAVAYVLLARRVSRRLAKVTSEVERHIRAGRNKQALAALERARPLSRRQLGLRRALDAQIGVLLYASMREFSRARPLLARAPRRAWHARAMAAADAFRRKQYDEMERGFEAALRGSRKTSLLYAAYAWCECKRGRAAHAREILAKGTERRPKDALLRKNLLALQNHRRMKMNGFGAEWYSLHLERQRAPQVVAQRPGDAVRGRVARRRR